MRSAFGKFTSASRALSTKALTGWLGVRYSSPSGPVVMRLSFNSSVLSVVPDHSGTPCAARQGNEVAHG